MSQQLMTLLPLVLLIFIMYFLLIRPQKKKEKAVNAMRSALKVGDDIITIGGICGKIVKTKDETLVIQVGADKTKMEVMRWSISKVVGDTPAPSKKSAEDATGEAPKKVVPKKLVKTTASATQEKDSIKVSEKIESNTEEKTEVAVEDLELDGDEKKEN